MLKCQLYNNIGPVNQTKLPFIEILTPAVQSPVKQEIYTAVTAFLHKILVLQLGPGYLL